MNTPVVPPQFSLQQLLQYFDLTEKLTGIKPTRIAVSKECVNWYEEQAKQVAKNFNIPTTKNYKKTEFMGVELTPIELK